MTGSIVTAAGATPAMPTPPGHAGGPWKPETMRVRINGALLAMSSIGPHDGMPLIVLHGGRGFGTHDGVFKTYAPLAGPFRIIGFDMRGHGESEAVPPFTFAQMVRDIETIRQELCGGRRIVLLGGSFGGMIALSYAITHPDHLAALILRGTAPSWHHETEALGSFRARASRAPMATEGMLDRLFTPTIENDEEFRLIMFALAPLYAEDPKTVDLDRLLSHVSRVRYNARVHNDLFADHSYDVVDRLGSIPCPTLVFCGAQDWICPPDQSRLIASRIPHAMLEIVTDANHGVPDPVALQLVSGFLKRQGLPA
ncbi:hypothetical protein KSAC_32180 (plasmid) [Komagataeibacter saccharivorans]|uniref:alpha/beta fold hydrolase n=1 Tax=Komagataeibacter saccharivorans TaxID=265959 RepID=UPI0010C54EC8|nr:alpha/beta hydrolase [Komagataeibacter saccharivorans]QBL95397.1 hypothetical protein KSAC_32180 [Komagataeibacter saccharivorans]